MSKKDLTFKKRVTIDKQLNVGPLCDMSVYPSEGWKIDNGNSYDRKYKMELSQFLNLVKSKKKQYMEEIDEKIENLKEHKKILENIEEVLNSQIDKKYSNIHILGKRNNYGFCYECGHEDVDDDYGEYTFSYFGYRNMTEKEKERKRKALKKQAASKEKAMLKQKEKLQKELEKLEKKLNK